METDYSDLLKQEIQILEELHHPYISVDEKYCLPYQQTKDAMTIKPSVTPNSEPEIPARILALDS